MPGFLGAIKGQFTETNKKTYAAQIGEDTLQFIAATECREPSQKTSLKNGKDKVKFATAFDKKKKKKNWECFTS